MFKRRARSRPFTMIDDGALLDPALSLRAKGLLAVMLTRPEGWEFYQTWLEKQSEDGRENLKGALLDLEAGGYLIRTPRKNGNRFGGYDYEFSDERIAEPKPKPKKSATKSVSDTARRRRETVAGNPSAIHKDLDNKDQYIDDRDRSEIDRLDLEPEPPAKTKPAKLPRSSFFDTAVERTERKKRASQRGTNSAGVKDFPGAARDALAETPDRLALAEAFHERRPELFLALWTILDEYDEPVERLDEWLPEAEKLVEIGGEQLVVYEARFVAANRDGIGSPFPYLRTLIENPNEKSVREATNRRSPRRTEGRTVRGERLRNRE